MTSLISSIMIGIKNFPFFALLFTLPILCVQAVKYRKVNLVRIGLNYMMILYTLCLIALVFFPLPDMAKAASLHTHEIQLIPFHFIADIIRETPFDLMNPHTYLPALFHSTILQVVFNVVMTIPFGMFLRYYFACSRKQVICSSFLLSLFIEVGQLTGLFFIYSGSYRLCDVDDLIANTLGGLLGYALVHVAEKYVPTIEAFDCVRTPVITAHHVTEA